jgi:hypothetical protein
VQRHAVLASVAEHVDEHVREMRRVDRDVAVARARERLDLVDDERLAGDLQQRLGQRVGERAHAIAAARGEDHRRRAPHQNVYPVLLCRPSTVSSSASIGRTRRSACTRRAGRP